MLTARKRCAKIWGNFLPQGAVLNTFSHPRFRIGWILLVLGILSSTFWTLFRWNWENRYTQTQITLDIDDTKSLADAYEMPQEKLLRDFHAKGARSLAIYNQNLTTLRDNGRIAITPREAAGSVAGASSARVPANYRFFVSSNDAALIGQILGRISAATGAQNQPLRVGNGFWIPASRQLLGDVAVGFDPQQIALAKSTGYTVTARVSNSLNFSQERLEELIFDVKSTGAKIVLFSEDEVLGYETLISNTARLMRENGLIFSNIEFSKQRGAADFAKNTEGLLVRVHSVQGDEASRTKPEMMIDRFVRAAKERNMRVLYVRLLRQQKGEPVEAKSPDAPIKLEKSPYEQNLHFIEEISAEITRQPLPIAALRTPLELGNGQPFGDYPMNQFAATVGESNAKWLRFLMLFGAGLGVVGSVSLVLNLFFDWSDSARRNWILLGLLIVFGLSFSAGIGAKIMALMGGATLTIVAVMWGGLPLVWDRLKTPVQGATPLQIAWFGFKIMALTTLLTLFASFLVVALLNNWRYMSKADEFLGEKMTQFLPLLLIPLAFLGEIFPHRVMQNGAKPSRQLAFARVHRALDRPFTAKIALMTFVGLLVVYVWMARFGNDSGMTISSFELSLRATLEKVFVTRPRTKEIFLGMPAFLLAIALMLRGQKLIALGAVAAAVIGQTDVLNSMCHIHTPVFYCIWRSLMGILIGGAVGAVAVVIFEKWVAPRVGFLNPNPSNFIPPGG